MLNVSGRDPQVLEERSSKKPGWTQPHSPAPEGNDRFSIQFDDQYASRHPGTIRMGAAGGYVSAANGELRVPLSEDRRCAEQPKPPAGDPGGPRH